MMLHKFVSRNRQLIESLAQSWQKAGVRGFTLLDTKGNPVFGDGATAGQQLTMPLGQYGALRITVGSPEPGAVNGYEVQLTCQAQLLTQILKRESELECMTVELMGAYDQLVAMYNLSQATRAHLDLESLLGSLLQEMVNLTEAKRGFVALQEDRGWKKLASVPPSLPTDDLVLSLSQVVRERGRPLMCNSPEECRRIFPSLPSQVERLSLTPVKVGGEVVAAMYRVSNSWKTNIFQGAKPVACKLEPELEELSIKAAKVLGCEYAGVDILEGPNGPVIIEVNSSPTWKGLYQATGVPIADLLIEHILKNAKQ